MEVTNSVESARKWSKENQAIYDPDGQNLQPVEAIEKTMPETSCWRDFKEILKPYLSLILITFVLLFVIGIYFGVKQSPGKY